jgi:predicted pyridoxine 5'-phosphate oxidase superfamily flavin-nucleotide-binding protein
MSEQEINEAIAEACGRERNPDGGWYPDNGLRVGTQAIPDYCNDLNAMHEAENFLKANQYMVYANILDSIEGSLFGIRATARQRAEAFLKTLGKWEEVQA